jgi:hypothetical protein
MLFLLFKSCFELFVDVLEYLGDVYWISFDEMNWFWNLPNIAIRLVMFSVLADTCFWFLGFVWDLLKVYNQFESKLHKHVGCLALTVLKFWISCMILMFWCYLLVFFIQIYLFIVMCLGRNKEACFRSKKIPVLEAW